MNIISFAIGKNSSQPVEPTLETISIESNGTYTPKEGVDGFNSITVSVPQDGALPASAFVLSGNCKNKFYGGNWDWFLENYGHQITTENITDATNMFCGSAVEEIPFEINLVNSDSGGYVYWMFYNCGNLLTLPKITGKIGTNDGLRSWFENCSKITEIPESYADLDFSAFNKCTGVQLKNYLFSGCERLRKIPKNFLRKLYDAGSNSGAGLQSGDSAMKGLVVLDEVDGFPVGTGDLTYSNPSNWNTGSFQRINRFVFDTNDDGTAKTANWQKQTFDLSYKVGYSTAAAVFTSRGLSADKEITGLTYLKLKNDADAWTISTGYSRYDKTSALETINSLPDTSAYLESSGGEANIIKFKGTAGTKTDGGAINKLTSAQIAIATAKGWTVTLV